MAERRIYVACLASYNNGVLHGRWIDCDGMTADDLQEEVNEMLQESNVPNAEEYAIHDHEGFGDLLSEHSPLSEVERLCDTFERLEEENIPAELFTAWCEETGLEFSEENIETYTEAYAGWGSSLADWAANHAEETGLADEVPESLRYYICWHDYAHDLQYAGDILTIEHGGKTHVFWSH